MSSDPDSGRTPITVYWLHYNFGRSSVVDVPSENYLYLFRDCELDLNKHYLDEICFEKEGEHERIAYKRLWMCELYRQIGGRTDHRANTILLEFDNRYCRFLRGPSPFDPKPGRDDKMFRLEEGDEVMEYWSPIGRNDVPYPWVVTKRWIYLPDDGVQRSKQAIKKEFRYGPYRQYYDCSKKEKERWLRIW